MLLNLPKQGSISLSVSRSSENENEFMLAFKVKDTGIGIPLKKQDIIFERFQQIGSLQEEYSERHGAGTGHCKKPFKIIGWCSIC